MLETGVHYPLRLDSLPTGWRAGYVGDFAKAIEPGFASGEHNQTGTGVPHLRPMNVDRDGKIDLSVVKYVAAEKGARRLSVGDVLFNNTNSPELIGKTAVVNQKGDFAFSNHMTRVLFNEDVLPKFAAIQLHFLWMRGYFRYNCVKHVNQASVSSKTLARAVPFIWAPPTEQERIVAEIEKQFSRLDEAVANLKRVKANLRRYKAAVLKAAVKGRLVPTEAELARREGRSYETGAQLLERILETRRSQWKGKGRYKEPAAPNTTDLPELPQGWAWASVDQLGDVQLGKMLDRQKHVSGQELPYLRNVNVRWGSVATNDLLTMFFEDDELDRFGLKQGDVLVCEGGEPGRAAVWDGKVSEMKYQKALHRVRLLESFASPLLVRVLEYLAATGRLEKWFTGSTIKHFTRESFLLLPVHLPPVPEQARIVAEVERHMSLIEDQEAAASCNVQRAERIRQALLSKEFSNAI